MDLLLKSDKDLEIFKRQYLQLVDIKDLRWPSRGILRLPTTQAWLFQELFSQAVAPYLPPERYQLRVLKRLLQAIEESIEDPEEDVGGLILQTIHTSMS
jgi:hypothetical protein